MNEDDDKYFESELLKQKNELLEETLRSFLSIILEELPIIRKKNEDIFNNLLSKMKEMGLIVSYHEPGSFLSADDEFISAGIKKADGINDGKVIRSFSYGCKINNRCIDDILERINHYAMPQTEEDECLIIEEYETDLDQETENYLKTKQKKITSHQDCIIINNPDQLIINNVCDDQILIQGNIARIKTKNDIYFGEMWIGENITIRYTNNKEEIRLEIHHSEKNNEMNILRSDNLHYEPKRIKNTFDYSLNDFFSNGEYITTIQYPKEYSITFIDCLTTRTKKYRYGETPNCNPNPSDKGVFNRWSPNITRVTGNKTYNAIYKEHEFMDLRKAALNNDEETIERYYFEDKETFNYVLESFRMDSTFHILDRIKKRFEKS